MIDLSLSRSMVCNGGGGGGGGGGGDGGEWFKVGGSCCCKNSLELCKWGAVIFAVFESKVFRRENV